jgi:hypothetical protein
MGSKFCLEQHPLVLMRPRIMPPYGWVGHIPFAYLAVDLLRPSTVVELGTHSGNSYLAFCQAVKAMKLNCRCTAVDTWRGDDHALHYGEQVYQSLRAVHDPLYEDFSRLLRASFDDAVTSFADRSIDLLHIDGLHTYDAVRHDFETWLPKLSRRAVVLLHDIEGDDRGFGVRQFFDELSTRYPSFSFSHSHGLGVVAVGTAVPETFATFMRHVQSSVETVRGFFEALAATLVDAQNRPAQGHLTEPQPVVCHLYYRQCDEAFDEARMTSMQVDVAVGVLDLHFQLPNDIRPDYLRFDPADVPGVYGIHQVTLRSADKNFSFPLQRLTDRLGHIQGELLPSLDARSVRLAGFDDDPYIEFEVGSVLGTMRDDETLALTIRVEYEVVLDEPEVRRLLERQGMVDMLALSRARADVQSLARLEKSRHAESCSHSAQLQTRLEQLEQSIDRLANRNVWSWFRRVR